MKACSWDFSPFTTTLTPQRHNRPEDVALLCRRPGLILAEDAALDVDSLRDDDEHHVGSEDKSSRRRRLKLFTVPHRDEVLLFLCLKFPGLNITFHTRYYDSNGTSQECVGDTEIFSENMANFIMCRNLEAVILFPF